MFSGILFLLLFTIGLIWLILASLKAGMIRIPPDFWILYSIAFMIGIEVPKAVYLETKQTWLWDYLYTFSHSLFALPVSAVGLLLLIRPHDVIAGLQYSIVSRLIKQANMDYQGRDILSARFIGAFMLFVGILIFIFVYPTVLTRVLEVAKAVSR